VGFGEAAFHLAKGLRAALDKTASTKG